MTNRIKYTKDIYLLDLLRIADSNFENSSLVYATMKILANMGGIVEKLINRELNKSGDYYYKGQLEGIIQGIQVDKFNV